ncbi:hypothetical protein EF888_01585 [Silicimonas algicola]|uniref:Uncharacterized protein n=1 Tax=Silicimonas algicola TaxID=1826607 RepID=A0A316GT45_9RHOB|nr:hypothetical protein [Silicimonas algicola]AZQ65932.1 hypothetical protein EF888_01585 [Silicimonas algicola]PWK58217.1 hypothetical protein C8D95_10122 [Silicimonas algicola]
MIEFVLIACLGGDMDTCRTETRLLTDITLVQCMMGTQFLVADWADEHPGWFVQKHFCRQFDPTRTNA